MASSPARISPADRATSSAASSCAHCALPVPRGLVDPAAERQFCCAGCKSVYALLHDQGLDRYYDLVDDDLRPAAPSDRGYGELDDPAFTERHCRPAAGGALSIKLYLQGVHCTACVWLVEKLPAIVPGVIASRLDLGRQMAEVTWDPSQVALSAIARQLDRLGYPVHPYRGADRLELRRADERALLIKIAVAGACAGNVMLIAAALYAGLFGAMGADHERFFRWASLIVTIPAVTFAAQPFFRGALSSLRARALHMDLPIAIGLAAGAIWGAVNTVRGVGEIYFDSVTALIFLLLIGRWIQLRQQRRAADATELLFSLTPNVARVIEAGAARELPIDALVPGLTVEVRAGETFPVDGDVVDGSSSVDSALLTGESVPERIGVGSQVHAGTVNLGAPVRVIARATGDETRVAELMRHVEEQAQRRAPIVRAADRIAGYFVATALALAGLTFALWLGAGTGVAMEHAVALLIVTCPCALGLATPLAVSVAIGRAARRGILIKGGDTLERLSRPGTIYLDKTGTLTRAQQTVVDRIGSDATLARAAAVEQASAHPLAIAMVRAAPGPLPLAADVTEEIGAGLRGRVGGVAVAVGSPAWIGALAGGLPRDIDQFVIRAAAAGRTPIAIAEDGQVTGAVAFGDPVRGDARATIDALRADGWTVRILSGDHPAVVRAVGAELGISARDCLGGASPERKLEVIRDAAARGRTVMVGDGVNDAAALAAATAGIAVHGSAEASLTSADVFIDRPGLAPVAELTRGARGALRVIHRNLAFSLVYNIAGAGLAIAGLIHPLIAAVLMPLSSITVVTSSVRGRSFPRSQP